MKKITVQSEIVKWFALLAMTMDHADRIIWRTKWVCYTLGRMAFPLFAYLIISNFCTYHKTEKYILRLGFFALLTQFILFPFNDYQNIFLSFLYAILFLGAIEKLSEKIKSFSIQLLISSLLLLFLSPLIAIDDDGFAGFFFLISLYAYQKKKTKINYFTVLLSSLMLNTYSLVTTFFTVGTAFLLLSFIKIKNSKRLVKWWFFYLYYPLHRLFLYFLAGSVYKIIKLLDIL